MKSYDISGVTRAERQASVTVYNVHLIVSMYIMTRLCGSDRDETTWGWGREGMSTPQLGSRPKLGGGGGGGGGWKFLQKCVKKQKFCLKMRENRDSREIFRLQRATFVAR